MAGTHEPAPVPCQLARPASLAMEAIMRGMVTESQRIGAKLVVLNMPYLAPVVQPLLAGDVPADAGGR